MPNAVDLGSVEPSMLQAALASGLVLTPVDSSALAARNDVEAVGTWLSARGGRSPNTFEAYKREAVRFLTWLHEQRLGLVDVKVEDVHSYIEHLRSPPTHWICPRKFADGTTRTSTQLMAGPLRENSISYARTVLTQLFGYLHDAGYLPRNAFKLSRRVSVVTQTQITRFLDLESWEWLWPWVCEQDGRNRERAAWAVRARWIIALLYHTGIRRSEAASGLMGDFARTDQCWTLRVVGKGSKVRYVTVNSSLLEELRMYRQHLKCRTPLPSPGEDMPLIAPLRTKQSNATMTGRNVGMIVSEVFKRACSECDDEHIASRLSNASTHWMRHTNATHRLRAGASLLTTQDELGHADPKTTRIYAATMNQERVEDAEKLVRLLRSVPSDAS
jgi:integrase/recombinase XerC